jgi:ribosomal protein L31E
MAKNKSEPKILFEREYVVPLRHEWLKVAKFKRANKAVKALKEFLVQHMKIYDRDLRKVKVNVDLNNEIRFRGMRKPLAKVKVKAIRYDNDTVVADLANPRPKIMFERKRKEHQKTKQDKEPKKEHEEKPITQETKEKEESSREEGIKEAKEDAKEHKHVSEDKQVKINRTVMRR